MLRDTLRTLPPLHPRGGPFVKSPPLTSRAFSQPAGSHDQQPRKRPNLNEHITYILEKKAVFHLNLMNNGEGSYKYAGYKNAINALKACPKKITSGEDALQMKYIGKKLATKVDEIIQTGTLKSLNESHIKAVADLMRIRGMKYDDAKPLCELGITSIEVLRKNTHLLTEEQATSLKYLEHYETEISEFEAEQIKDALESTLREMVHESCSIEAVGTYRSKQPIKEGMDLILTTPLYNNIVRETMNPDGSRDIFLKKVVEALSQNGILASDLAPKEKRKLIGLVNVKNFKSGKTRLIRLHVVTKEENAFARLFLTGMPRFIRAFKASAKMKGYTNKMFGLNRPGEDGETIPILAENEEDIFEILNIKYLKPTCRRAIAPTPVRCENDAGEIMGDGYGLLLPEDIPTH